MKFARKRPLCAWVSVKVRQVIARESSVYSYKTLQLEASPTSPHGCDPLFRMTAEFYQMLLRNLILAYIQDLLMLSSILNNLKTHNCEYISKLTGFVPVPTAYWKWTISMLPYGYFGNFVISAFPIVIFYCGLIYDEFYSWCTNLFKL